MAFALAIAGPAQAYQPRYLVVKQNGDCKVGPASDIRGSFNIKNVSRQTVQVSISPVQGDGYEFRYILDARVLRPDQDANVHFVGSVRTDGKYEINATIEMQIGTLRFTHSVPLYIVVQGGRFSVATYDDLYMQPDVPDRQMGLSFSSGEDKGQFKRGDEYQFPMPSVLQMEEMDPRAIYRIPLDSAGPNNCGGGNCPNPTSFRTLDTFTVNDIVKKPDQVSVLATVARGEFHWRGMDGNLHPAFGWRVKAWQKVLGAFWSVVAEDWIQWDGKWQLNIATLPFTAETRFQYVAANRFFTPQTSGGDTYRWVGPVRASIAANHNEGSWIADTSSGGVRGLGEIYREGMTMWSKMYWEGDINPLRGSSIKVFFPNTTYDCGDGSGDPWSCASRDGRIWLIPSHASRNGVMQHELAHQINYEYWNNNLPPNSGGSHNLTDCATAGLAETEGFANFMVFWTQSARNADPNAGFDFHVEDPSFACASPLNRNESWVAGALWDLHDTRGDGQDNLWFIHPGATPAIYLREGKRDSFAEFHSIYRSRANTEHRSIIDRIFQQDKIIP